MKNIELIRIDGIGNHSLLSEESLLNLYIWATINDEIPNSIEHINGVFMVPLFMLLLLFNNDVLNNYELAKDSAKKYHDKVNMRRVFCERFPQNDLIEIDYGKLAFTQLYKLMELLNFLEVIPRYQPLYKHLLDDFECSTKEEFFKALGGAVVSPLHQKPGINYLIIDGSSEAKKSKEFLDKLAFDGGDITLGPTDYKFLRDKPLQKLPAEYRIVFDLFLIKKLYNGLVFKLSGYVNENPPLFNGPLFGGIRDDFSEGILVYETLYDALPQKGVIKIKGNDFKAAGIEREPDFYSRINNNIILWESKDFFMIAKDKLSYDFDVIVGGLRKDGRLGKAVVQSATNVGRALRQSLKLDGGYNSKTITIFPVIILHDSLYNTPGLNYWVNIWFQEELDKIKAGVEFKDINFSNIKPITLVDIDTLILYRSNFENCELDIYELIERYQQYVKFDQVGEGMNEDFGRAILPFSEFVEHKASDMQIIPKLDLIEEIYKASGYIDN